MTVEQASGQWVPVALADGSVRHDWQPEQQPPSPDGTQGAWRIVPGPDQVTGMWTWFPAQIAAPQYAPQYAAQYARQPAPQPVAAASRPVAVAPRPRVWVVAVVVVALLVVAFLVLRGGGGSDSGRIGVSTLSDSQKKATLVVSANSYLAALLAGHGAEAAKYLDPTVCGNADKADVGQLATFLAKTAPGAIGKVSSVEVSGDDGSVTGYDLSAGTPDAVRAAIEQGYTAGGEFSWHLRSERWVFDSEC